MASTQLLAAIDIGTTKTVVLIGEMSTGKRLNIIGLGERETQGMRKGEITELPVLKEIVHNVIHDAEKSAGVQVSSAYLSLSGAHLNGERNTGVATVSSSNRCVNANDIERAVREAKHRQLADGRVLINHIRQPYFLDSVMRENPLGMSGQRLEASFWAIDAEESYVRDLIHISQTYSLYVPDLIVSGLASGRMVVDDTMRQNGVLVVDIGGGTTDYVLYRKGYVYCTGVLPIGGEHITNDLCLGLRLKYKDAEKLKCDRGSATVTQEDAKRELWLYGDKSIGDRCVYAHSMNQIINARVDELFAILRRRLGSKLTREEIVAGVVLTGGTSKLRNIDQVAMQALGIDARIGELPDWISEKLADAKYSTAHGLLDYALRGVRNKKAPAKNSLWGSIKKYIPF